MLLKIISLLEEIILIILMSVLVILTFINVILRYFLGSSISGYVEISILIFSWITFVGASLAFKHNSHITINLLDSILPSAFKKVLHFCINLLLFVFFIVMTYYGTVFTIQTFGETLGASNIPKALVYLSFPIGFGLMTIQLVRQSFIKFKEVGEG